MSVTSPCVNLCKVLPQTYKCIGCGRTLKEIAEWSKMTAQQKKKVLNSLSGEKS
jgi:uncharacterized protein